MLPTPTTLPVATLRAERIRASVSILQTLYFFPRNISGRTYSRDRTVVQCCGDFRKWNTFSDHFAAACRYENKSRAHHTYMSPLSVSYPLLFPHHVTKVGNLVFTTHHLGQWQSSPETSLQDEPLKFKLADSVRLAYFELFYQRRTSIGHSCSIFLLPGQSLQLSHFLQHYILELDFWHIPRFATRVCRLYDLRE